MHLFKKKIFLVFLFKRKNLKIFATQPITGGQISLNDPTPTLVLD